MNVLLIDDHRMLRDSVAEFLKGESFIEEVRAFESIDEALAAMKEAPADLVITDISFPAGSGKEVLKWLRAESPQTRAICMTMHAELSLLRDVARLGARGYVTKASGYNELVLAIQRVAAGGYFLDQTMLGQVMEHLSRGDDIDIGPESPLRLLSQREREVFSLLLEDRDIAAIADVLSISSKTVENHRSNIYQKLGVHDRLSLFRLAREYHLID